MTSPLDPGDQNFEDASSQLDAGLRTCRAVLSNYRSLLAGDGAEEGVHAGFTEPGEASERSAD